MVGETRHFWIPVFPLGPDPAQRCRSVVLGTGTVVPALAPAPSPWPWAGLWGGDGGEERDPPLKGEIICSLCPSLEKKKRKVKKKKISFLLEPSLSHPLCREDLGRGQWKKAKRVFKRQLEKREGGEKT